MSSSKKVRAVTVEDGDDEDGSGIFSAGSSVSGSSMVGTGQGAPSYFEVTGDHCRAVTKGAGGVSYLCTKPSTCGSRTHSTARNPSPRGELGYYKVARTMTGTKPPL